MRCPVNDRSGPPCCRVELPPWCAGPAGLLAILQRWPCCPGGAASLVRWPCWPAGDPAQRQPGPVPIWPALLPGGAASLVRWPCWLLPIRPGVRWPGGVAALVRCYAGRAGLHRSRHAATPSRRAAGASHHAASRPAAPAPGSDSYAVAFIATRITAHRSALPRKQQLRCCSYRYAHARRGCKPLWVCFYTRV